MISLRVVLAALAAILVGSCAPQQELASDSAAPSPTRTSAQRTDGPSVRFLQPINDASASAGSIDLAVEVENFDVVAKQFQPAVIGEGHVHFYLDVDDLPTTHARPNSGEYRSVSSTTYVWTGVTAGEHTFAVQLVGNDHVPLDPPAKDEVTIRVR